MNPNPFKRDEIILLLGAGASVEANIPASVQMIDQIEELLKEEWSEYTNLYHYVKSAIYYADGIQGNFEGTGYNVERLVNTLDEISKRDDHPLYPFIGAWNPKLSEVAGQDFEKISDFKGEIIKKLRDDWVQLELKDDGSYYASYYEGLVNLQREYQHPLRVFTLNYDLCVEKNCEGINIERGFTGTRRWDWRMFDDAHGDPADLYLYKLHGSVDWSYDNGGNLIYHESSSQIEPEDLAIIFGTTYKLQYIDPFLFFAYEFRKWTLDDGKLIVVIGYSFADEHINGILTQSLNNNSERKLLSIAPLDESETVKKKQLYIKEILKTSHDDQIVGWDYGAKDFMTQKMKVEELAKLFPLDEEPIQELSDK
jgi:hypothetical protein